MEKTNKTKKQKKNISSQKTEKKVENEQLIFKNKMKRKLL